MVGCVDDSRVRRRPWSNNALLRWGLGGAGPPAPAPGGEGVAYLVTPENSGDTKDKACK